MRRQAEVQSASGLRALVFLFLALIAGGAATVMAYQLTLSYQARIAEAEKPEETEMVIVAAGELYPGVTITESDIVGVVMPKRYIPADGFTSPETVVGKVPRERILAGEFIRLGRLADERTGVGLNALIAGGMRAVSINISDGAAVSGFLNPGNRVDILVTMEDENGGTRETITLLQTVPVLAVNARLFKEEAETDPRTGKRRRPSRAVRPSVTLMVTPEQAESVAHAEKQGEITLALRNDIDLAESTTEKVSASDLLGQTEPPPPPVKPVKAQPAGNSVIIYRGTQRDEKSVGADGTIIR